MSTENTAAPEVVATGTIVADPAAAAATVVAPVVAPAPIDPAAAKFAALSRQEKLLRQQARDNAAEKAQLAKDRAALETDIRGKMIDPEAFKKNPYKVMKEHGLTLEQIAEIALNDGNPTAESLLTESEKRMQARIDAMDAKLKAKEDAEAEQQRDQAVQNFMTALTETVNGSTEYELIKANDAVDLVYEVINADFENKLAAHLEEHDEEPDAETRRGFIMSNKDACDKVELHLLDEAKKHVKLPKIQGLFAPAATKVEPVKAQTTLTNTDASTVPSRGDRMLTDDESRREAAKLIKWQE